MVGSNALRALEWAYERALRLYPRAYRDEYGVEMAWVFARGVQDAAEQSWGRLLGQSIRELCDLPGAALFAWMRELRKEGLPVSGGNEDMLGPSKQERIRWEPRLPQALVAELYAQDAQGIVDEALIERVAAALDARAESMLLVTRRQIPCPRCGTVFDLGDVWRDADVVQCPKPGCGWETTYRVCRNSWRRRHLFGHSLLASLKEYRVGYGEAESLEAKMQLIDRLLHAFGRDPRTGQVRWPSVGHFVEGKSPKGVALLEGLVYGPGSTPGLRETQQRWLRMLQGKRETTSGEGARCGV
jgi:hypothetical protein